MTERRLRVRAVVFAVMVVLSMVPAGVALTGPSVAQSDAADGAGNDEGSDTGRSGDSSESSGSTSGDRGANGDTSDRGSNAGNSDRGANAGNSDRGANGDTSDRGANAGSGGDNGNGGAGVSGGSEGGGPGGADGPAANGDRRAADGRAPGGGDDAAGPGHDRAEAAGQRATDRATDAAEGAGRPAEERGPRAGTGAGPEMATVVDQVSRSAPDAAATVPIEDTEPDSPGLTVAAGPGTATVTSVTLADEERRGTVDIKEYSDLPPAVTDAVAATVARDITAARASAGRAPNGSMADVATNRTAADVATNRTAAELPTNGTVTDVAPNGSAADVTTNRSTAGVAATQSAVADRVSVVTVANISVFDENGTEASDAAATIRMAVGPNEMDDPEEAVVVHETADGWEELDTTVEEATNESLTMAAETGGFSLFAVAEIDTDEDAASNRGRSETANGTAGANTSRSTETTRSTVTDDSTPGFGVWVALAAIAGFVSLSRRRDR